MVWVILAFSTLPGTSLLLGCPGCAGWWMGSKGWEKSAAFPFWAVLRWQLLQGCSLCPVLCGYAEERLTST